MGAPQIWSYMRDDAARQVHAMVVSQQAFTRPYFIAAGTPPELVSTLRTAFDATMRDPQFLADADKMRIDVCPAGRHGAGAGRQAYATPKAIVEQARCDQAVARPRKFHDLKCTQVLHNSATATLANIALRTGARAADFYAARPSIL
jgi:hypothetical protein